METIISTDHVGRDERLALWHDAVRDNLVTCRFQCADQTDFNGSLRCRSLSSLRITQVTTATQHAVARSPRAALGTSDDYYLAAVGLSGQAVLEQDGRKALLERGDLALYDASRPFQFDIDSQNSLLILRMPRGLLQQRISRVERLTAVRMRRASELVDLFTGFAVRLLRLREEFEPVIVETIAGQTLDLLALALTQSDAAASGLNMERISTLYRIRNFVETHLQDPELSPAIVASAMGTSSRYIHKLFRNENTSLMRYVWNRRLEECSRELCDTARSADGISQIAFKWGFNELSHFSRVFKARFGLSPREYRRLNEPRERITTKMWAVNQFPTA